MGKILTLSTLVLAVVGACVSLPGCDQEGAHLQADPPKLTNLEGHPMCLDGWEVLYLGNGNVQYRHQHDVAEHLISCQGADNG